MKMTSNKDSKDLEAKIYDSLETVPVVIEHFNIQDHSDDFGSIDSHTFVFLNRETRDSYWAKNPRGSLFPVISSNLDIGEIFLDEYLDLKKEGGYSSIGYTPNIKGNLLEKKALRISTIAHEGQFREGTGEPYVEHPKRVAERFLELRYGGNDRYESTAIALLHDVVEDTPITYEFLENYVGKNVVEGVRILTRDINNTEYKERLISAPEDIQLIKIFDTLDNLGGLQYLSEKGKRRKINDSLTFYIPLALRLNQEDLAKEMEKLIRPYLNEVIS